MRLAEHEGEGDNKELFTEVVVDVQDPAAPIFEATRHGEGSHDTGRAITRLSEIVYHGCDRSKPPLCRSSENTPGSYSASFKWDR